MGGLTVRDLRGLKGTRRIAFVQVTREDEAVAAAEAGMDMIGTAFLPETRVFPKSVPNAHFQFGLRWGEHASASEALREAMDAMNAGGQSIYCGMSAQVIEVLAREGVPVIAHTGLVPPKMTWTGGYRAVGKTRDDALKIWRDVRDFEAAGAFAVEMEVVPARLASEITARTSLLTISLGSGRGCDAEYLFSADLLGENRGHVPRHAKTYRNFASMRDEMQRERVAAYREYVADVGSGAFPEERHLVGIREDVLAGIVAEMDARGG